MPMTWTTPVGRSRWAMEVPFSLPTTIQVGDSVCRLARIEPLLTDVVPADNADASRRVVTGSFGPNALYVNFAQMTTTQVSGASGSSTPSTSRI